MAEPTTGLILGKFLPPHLGHRYLIEFAQQYVDQLTVVIETAHDEIDGALRKQWLQTMVPECRVLGLDHPMPQEPGERADFWQVWRQVLLELHGSKPDYLFASESYGWKLAETLESKFVPVDPDRSNVSISGTSIRQSPWQHWEYLPRPARAYYAKRVCVFGAESTGKTTLCQHLADVFGTKWVPEYARTHLNCKSQSQSQSYGAEAGPNDPIAIEPGDIECIARGQAASEDAIVRDANRILICDSDLLLTEIWSETLFGDCPSWIRTLARQRHYDLYLVCQPDVPWVADPVRYTPDDRGEFHHRCTELLQQLNRPFQVLAGSWEQRNEQAVQAVRTLFES